MSGSALAFTLDTFFTFGGTMKILASTNLYLKPE